MKCPFCESEMTKKSETTYEEYGLEGEGVIITCLCPNCLSFTESCSHIKEHKEESKEKIKEKKSFKTIIDEGIQRLYDKSPILTNILKGISAGLFIFTVVTIFLAISALLCKISVVLYLVTILCFICVLIAFGVDAGI